uniref:Uncharacterized protein n=1 Tax=Salix viminalis TaxID=40686 RepID=A0A6N2LVC7_SALVM
MSIGAQTELYTEEMKKRKKRETDRRYRQNKKRAVQETENKLAMAITENENPEALCRRTPARNLPSDKPATID